jgi:hypothetical protein
MASNQPREHERAGLRRDPAAQDPAKVPAERGVPDAEHGQYGLVREGSKEAEGLSEEQIRGTQPRR